MNDQNKLYNAGKSSFSMKINQYSDSLTVAPTGLIIPVEYDTKQTEVKPDWNSYKVMLSQT